MTTPEAMEELMGEALFRLSHELQVRGLFSQGETSFTVAYEKVVAAFTKARQAPARPNDAAFIGPDDPLCLRLSKECIERIEAAEQARIAGAAALRNVPLGSRQAPEREGEIERIAKALAAAHGAMAGHDYALNAYRAGVDMTIDYWNALAEAAVAVPTRHPGSFVPVTGKVGESASKLLGGQE
jgi:hypothetical protein